MLIGLLETVGHRVAERLDALFLVDRHDGPPRCSLPGAHVLATGAADDHEALARTIYDHGIDQVIEVADVDTVATSAVCAALGADYLSASLQGDLPTLVAASRLLGDRPDTRGASHLIGAGMNPGIVNALAVVGVDELARRSRIPVRELDLYAIHVTEQDTTAAVDTLDHDAFPMSWSPRHALDELLEPQAMYIGRGRLARLPHRPHDTLYAARCGDREIQAMIVPHEELVSIGSRFPDVESAFFYAIPAESYWLLRRRPARPANEWPTRRLYEPHSRGLVGHDRTGVLIASRRAGELWLGYEHASSTTVAGTGNGTLLQAAAGVLAGWTLLGTRRGLHVVDELDVHAYLALVERVLGRRRVHHAPDARARTIAERRIEHARSTRLDPRADSSR